MVNDMQNLTPEERAALSRALDNILVSIGMLCRYCKGTGHDLTTCEAMEFDRGFNDL